MGRYSHVVYAWRNGDEMDRMPIACPDERAAHGMFSYVLGKGSGYDNAELHERVGDSDEFEIVIGNPASPHLTFDEQGDNAPSPCACWHVGYSNLLTEDLVLHPAEWRDGARSAFEVANDL